jgi:hypothetical protein
LALLASGCLVAGGMGGWAVASCSQAAAERSPEQSVADDMIGRYQLRSDQARSLRIVLQWDRLEEDALRRRIEWNQLPDELQRQLLDVHRKTRELIRIGVLDDKQRVLYDRDTQPSANPATGK